MNASLLELMEELLQSIEQRESGDPDAPAWEAAARIRRLEEELAARLAAARTDAGLGFGGDIQVRPDEALAGIA
jgi:hypothetical protein